MFAPGSRLYNHRFQWRILTKSALSAKPMVGVHVATPPNFIDFLPTNSSRLKHSPATIATVWVWAWAGLAGLGLGLGLDLGLVLSLGLDLGLVLSPSLDIGLVLSVVLDLGLLSSLGLALNVEEYV